jgi:hypothetical protein
MGVSRRSLALGHRRRLSQAAANSRWRRSAKLRRWSSASEDARPRHATRRRHGAAGRCAALTRSAARLGSRTLGMQGPGRRRIDTGMAVIPVDAVARRWVLAQNFSDAPGACAALCRLSLRDDAISDLEGHSLLPSIAAGSAYELNAGAGKCVVTDAQPGLSDPAPSSSTARSANAGRSGHGGRQPAVCLHPYAVPQTRRRAPRDRRGEALSRWPPTRAWAVGVIGSAPRGGCTSGGRTRVAARTTTKKRCATPSEAERGRPGPSAGGGRGRRR